MGLWKDGPLQMALKVEGGHEPRNSGRLENGKKPMFPWRPSKRMQPSQPLLHSAQGDLYQTAKSQHCKIINVILNTEFVIICCNNSRKLLIIYNTSLHRYLKKSLKSEFPVGTGVQIMKLKS